LQDYWTELESEDLMPCGFMEYWLIKAGEVDYKGMKPELSTPKCKYLAFYFCLLSTGIDHELFNIFFFKL
jgi:hypothetical protein